MRAPWLIPFLLLLPTLLPATEAGQILVAPGDRHPQPGQRGLNEIDELPTREAVCPVCGFAVVAPLVDTLMRRPAGFTGELRWRMDAAGRDSDLSPHPGPGKIAYQADILVCPSCGYAREADRFPLPVSRQAAQWVLSSLRPALRAVQRELLAKRANEMDEEEIAVFFNRQDAIPDSVRLEHWSTYLAATRVPALERARAARLSAWAARREIASAPKGRLLSARTEAIKRDLAERRRGAPGLDGDLEAIDALLRRQRVQRRNRLPGPDSMAARLMQAGLYDRLGFLDEAEKIVETLYHECRERFLRPEQDPLWGSTSTRAPKTQRLNELEDFRADIENEVFSRLQTLRRERENLAVAADLLRQAIRDGALDDKPDEALFYAYLVADFLRRVGNLPLAAEWFKNLQLIAPPDTPVHRAATKQLEYVGKEAGDKVNLLSALGQDGELFAKLRRVCAGR